MKRKKRDLRRFLAVLFCAAAAVLLLCRLEDAAEGAREGLLLCAQTVIPMLFPFMAVSGFLVLSGGSELLGRWLQPVTKRLFRLPGAAAAGLLMSFIGGYPVGAQNAARLLERGLIKDDQAELMALICCCPGPTFAIGAVGSAVLGSARSGTILYASCVLSCLLTGVVFSRLYRFRPDAGSKAARETSLAQAFVEGTATASNGMFVICAWVILFSAVLAVADSLSLPEGVSRVLGPLLEVTVGSRGAFEAFGPLGVAAACGFGGLSVHCQMFSALPRLRLPRFFAARALCAFLNVLICWGLFLLFPQEKPAFANGVAPLPALGTGGVGASLMLMLLSAVLVCSVPVAHRPRVDFTGDL